MLRFRLSAVLITVMFGVLAVGNCWAVSAAEIPKSRDVLVEMTNVLRAKGVEGFLVQATQQKWVAPKIYSAWYVARLPDDPAGLRKAEEAKSELGLEFAKQLSVIAKTVRETKNAELLERSSNTLFGAVEWLGHSVGYGNLLLQDRAYDIASVAAVKFMADLSYPMDKAEAAMKRFDWSWAKAENRRQVLYEESGGTHFATVLPGDAQDTYTYEWRHGVQMVLDLRKTKIPPDLEIFVIDDSKADETIGLPETTWRQRVHFKMGEGNFGSVNLRNLPSLREFRKRYGVFPTKPVKYVKHESESDIRAAFWELCWKDPFPVLGAAGVYEDYCNNRLSDEGYRSIRTH
jgi:hypothetical protein